MVVLEGQGLFGKGTVAKSRLTTVGIYARKYLNCSPFPAAIIPCDALVEIKRLQPGRQELRERVLELEMKDYHYSAGSECVLFAGCDYRIGYCVKFDYELIGSEL